ncbi:ArsR/SmtB family transcription factor [Halobacterium wangiae]|uniref:ArsR/SmtB family transcription factor n=1 Tax=Halobacterium wangiae TaxID=2902623 RepID=UPI001E6252B1|nr:helix-turn-helix domain-containing protein [Halobacterium wangiae]
MSEDAEDAFAAVADELRVRILQALWDAEDPLSFSELRDRVDVRDSGRFNYHLGELRGRFVEQTEDGYELRFAGMKLVTALHSGIYTEDVSVGPAPVDGECVVCGGDLEVHYEDERGRVDCVDCEMAVISTGVPPAFVDGREDDLAAAIDGYVRSTQRKFADGFCPACSGSTTGRLEDGEHGPQMLYTCDRCGGEFQGLVAAAVVDHTEVVAFYHEHGHDVRDIPVWELDWFDDAGWDGDHAVVTVSLDGDELALTVDENLDVVGSERA